MQKAIHLDAPFECCWQIFVNGLQRCSASKLSTILSQPIFGRKDFAMREEFGFLADHGRFTPAEIERIEKEFPLLSNQEKIQLMIAWREVDRAWRTSALRYANSKRMAKAG
jgi:hypothetical protein